MDSEAEQAFQLFDVAGKGFIDLEDLRRSCAQLGEDLTAEQLESMLELAGSNGRVSREEFEKLWEHIG
ncbi:hypothetical protein SJAG_00719 [Schizosaccharomyces japonicus yFS275]|uniref:EF-hand domain-containing protein n=1 Tax=Schizosaccharomyces japonicus (strain yFS275 / FY16936) TaxID=402676 RepID=B6JWE3_SCHJY|nr:hypothetical protein SJAG_00719 [Schizosaccharomyces japonicus yFS275]EEB05694.1 hypothetical protein SJAG_00719 [Schizosaccharomyces japonicus yFS275]